MEDGEGFRLEDAGGDLAAVVQGRLLEEVQKPAGRAAFRISDAEDDAADAAVDDGSGAHGAGFLRHVEVAFGETPIAEGLLGLAEGHLLG